MGLMRGTAAAGDNVLREPSGVRLRRISNGEGGDGQMVRRVHAVEPDRDACGGVPHEARDYSGVHGPMAATASAAVASTMTRPVIAAVAMTYPTVSGCPNRFAKVENNPLK
jgi:hypothetical protein